MNTANLLEPQLNACLLGEPSDKAIVFIHGYVKDNFSTWYTAFGLPLAAQAQVLLYDLRGHGESEVPATGYDLNTHAADLLRLLSNDPGLGQQKVHLVGHSMGALIALRFALLHPSRVATLTLVDAPMPAASYVGPSLLVDPAEFMQLGELIAQSSATLGRRERKMMARIDRLINHTSLVSDVLKTHEEPPTLLATLDLPVHLIYGEFSPCFKSSEYLQNHLPQSQLTVLPCGHYVPQEKPSELRHCIGQFLSLHSNLEFV